MHVLNPVNRSALVPNSPTDVARDSSGDHPSTLLEVVRVSSSNLIDGLLEDPMLTASALATFKAAFKELYSFSAVSPLDFSCG